MKKRTARIAASLLTSAFAMAAGALHLEWVGYDYFDRENGKNILCTIDPQCRQMTVEEHALARKYFGDRINYKKVKIFDRPFMRMIGHNNTGLSPNGNLYFARAENYRPNFVRDLSSAALFIHEMTHVAQYQNGMNVPKQAFLTWLRHDFNYEAAYDYKIDGSHAYIDMNLEQQAKVMEDYFIKRHNFELQTTGEAVIDGSAKPVRFATFGQKWLKERCRELKQYEAKLAPVHPIKPDDLCLPPAPQGRLKIDESRFFTPP